jgi:hypothetical protein
MSLHLRPQPTRVGSESRSITSEPDCSGAVMGGAAIGGLTVTMGGTKFGKFPTAFSCVASMLAACVSGANGAVLGAIPVV